MRRRLAVVALALIVPAAASAHITIAPPFVAQGVKTTISFETPNERPPHATVSLAVEVPSGITVVRDMAPRGWSSTVAGSTVTWSGGRIEDRATATFSVRIVAEGRAGTASFRAVQDYDDGEAVAWAADLSVLPAAGTAAPKQHPWGAVVAALAGIVVIVAGLVVVRALRRKSLQER